MRPKSRKLSPLSETTSIPVHFPTFTMACTGSERQNRDIENDTNLFVLRWSYFAMETKQTTLYDSITLRLLLHSFSVRRHPIRCGVYFAEKHNFSINPWIVGHPTTVFCKISVRRSKCFLEFSITWGWLKISKWPFHSCTIFEAYVIIPYDFLKS